MRKDKDGGKIMRDTMNICILLNRDPLAPIVYSPNSPEGVMREVVNI